ncbi:hypothetical protein [Prosthecobacter sp.]|uniref:hypothetical protein n=1 Tax=Prosthecobacter sp. TaxID=1965333 RepID=UPI0037830737
MFRVLDLEFHLGQPQKADGLSSRHQGQGIRPADLGRPELAAIRAALKSDWDKLNTLCLAADPMAPGKDVLCLVNPRFGSELMELSESPRWREELREGLAADDALLFPDKQKKTRWRLWGGGRTPSGAEQEEYAPPPAAPEAVLFAALDVVFPPGVHPKAKDLEEIQATLARLRSTINVSSDKLGKRVPIPLLPDLNGGAIRRLLSVGSGWPAALEEMLDQDAELLASLKDTCAEKPRPASEQGFTGEIWTPRSEEMLHGALALEAAQRAASQRREGLGAGISMATWLAAFEETVEGPLRRLPDARLQRVRTFSLAAANAQDGLWVGVTAPGFVRLEVIASGVSGLKLVADWLPSENHPRAASRLLALLKKAGRYPALGTVRHLAQAWAALAPMKPWPELVASLPWASASTLDELACHGAELNHAANADDQTLNAVLDALPSVMLAAQWPGALENARQVFMALRPAGERLEKSLQVIIDRLQKSPDFTVSHLSDVVLLARLSGQSGSVLAIAQEVCLLGRRFGCPPELARGLLAGLVSGAMLEDETARQLGNLCRRVLSQAGSHHIRLREALSQLLQPLLLTCQPFGGLGEFLLEAIASHLRREAPSDLPQSWTPPADLKAEAWLAALPAFSELAVQMGSPRWPVEQLHLLWGWLEAPQPLAVPAEAPGVFYLALESWLEGQEFTNGANANLKSLADQATRLQFLRLLHSAHAVADEARSSWIKAHSSLVPWGGLGREWLSICVSASSEAEAAHLWCRGLKVLTLWGRLGSTSAWLTELGHEVPWCRPAWRELVPAFVENDDGACPPQVAEEVVRELFTVPHEDSAKLQRWRRLLWLLPAEMRRTHSVAASIETCTAGAVCAGTSDAFLSAESVLSELGGCMLAEDDQNHAKRWAALLPQEAAHAPARLTLRSSFLTRSLLKNTRQDLFLQRLVSFWPELVSRLFAASEPVLFDVEIWQLIKHAGAPEDDYKRQAAVRLVTDISRLPVGEAAGALLRLLRVLPEARRQVLDHATLLRSLLTWMLSRPGARPAWTTLSELLVDPVSESLALGVAADHLQNTSGKVSAADLEFLATLRPALVKVLPELKSKVGEEGLRNRLLTTVLCTPGSQMSVSWRRHVADEFHALLHIRPEEAAAIARLSPLLS